MGPTASPESSGPFPGVIPDSGPDYRFPVNPLFPEILAPGIRSCLDDDMMTPKQCCITFSKKFRAGPYRRLVPQGEPT